METRNTIRSSSFLIGIAIIILFLALSMAFYVNRTVENQRFDAIVINEIGIIRGSIQRVTKLAISDTDLFPDELISEIDDMFTHFIYKETENVHTGVGVVIFDALVSLQKDWFDFKLMLFAYQAFPSEQLKIDIIEKSEYCWGVSDAVVLKAQETSQSKITDFKLFYKILAINAIAAIVIIIYVIFIVRKKLEFESLHDSLTTLQNRRSFSNAIQYEMARSNRYSSKFALILFDVDKFKQINDNHGHGVGDNHLITLASIVLGSIRKSDALFRMGGDEFAIICPETTAEQAFLLAENIRKRIEEYSSPTCKVETISLGIAEYQEGFTKEQIYQFADLALYSAKESGRNKTRIYGNKEGAVEKTTP